MPTRSLTVGPIEWSITAEESLGSVVDQVTAGSMNRASTDEGVNLDVSASRAVEMRLDVSASRAAETSLDVSASRAVETSLHLTLSVSCDRTSRRALPRLPAFTVEGDRLVDRSQGWDAELHFTPRRIMARFELVDVAVFEVPWASQLMALNVAAALRVALGMAAPLAGALLFHAAALEATSAALFLGASGQGKTTMASRLPGWRLLADDAVLVWRDPTGWWASGTPLPGKEALPRSLTPAPLSALIFLEPSSPSLALTPLSAGEAGFLLMSRLHWFGEPTPALVSLGAALANDVQAHRLSSSLAHDVAAPLSALVQPHAMGRA